MTRCDARVGIVATAAGLAITLGTAAAGDDTPDARRAFAAELMADASTRSSLLTAEEGETTVKLGGWAQFRYYMNFRDNPQAATFHDSGFTNGFEATRTRLNVTGSIMSKDLTYKIEGEFSKSTGAFGLLDAYGNYKFNDPSSVRAGQFKAPLLREETIPDTYQLSVNRSAVNEVFSQKRSQGVQYGYQAEQFQFRVDFNDGLNTLNTEYTSPAEADWAVTARVDIKGGGSWKDFDQFTSWRGNANAWLLGFAAHFQNDGNTAASATVVQQTRLEYTADFGFQGNGWNVYVAGIGRHLDPSAGTTLDDFGAELQGGVFVSDNTELYARWDSIFADSDRPNHDTFNTLSTGMNWYPFAKSQAVKLSGDVCWFFNATTSNDLAASLATNNNIGLLPSAEDNQFVIRLQFQWIF